jgi:hypothetical protein
MSCAAPHPQRPLGDVNAVSTGSPLAELHRFGYSRQRLDDLGTTGRNHVLMMQAAGVAGGSASRLSHVTADAVLTHSRFGSASEQPVWTRITRLPAVLVCGRAGLEPATNGL